MLILMTGLVIIKQSKGRRITRMGLVYWWSFTGSLIGVLDILIDIFWTPFYFYSIVHKICTFKCLEIMSVIELKTVMSKLTSFLFSLFSFILGQAFQGIYDHSVNNKNLYPYSLVPSRINNLRKVFFAYLEGGDTEFRNTCLHNIWIPISLF